MTVYSFLDLAMAFNHPLTGPISFQGQLGFGSLVVEMTTERSSLNTASDGAIMISSIAGNSGHLTVETQQTSTIHEFLNSWLNLLLQAQNQGDVTTWASATLSARSLTTSTSHICTGVCPAKYPSFPYRAQGENVTWTLYAADIANG